MQNPRFTKEEQSIIQECDTPEKVQNFLNSLDYNFEESGVKTWRSFRGVVQHRKAHCFEAAITAAAILSQHGFPPLVICIEASDIDHNIFAFWQNGKVGSLAKSRQVELHDRPPTYKTYRDLVMSYYPDYYNWFTQDRNDITLRGYAIVDLRIFSKNWITGKNLSFIEKHLYTIPYKKIFPENRDMFYYSQRDGRTITIK